jgi:hypothetical protein
MDASMNLEQALEEQMLAMYQLTSLVISWVEYMFAACRPWMAA